tara:strand:+ start:1061 stop:1207 length:147 start_codon:yes stop_codon:yes gene_type:complete
MFAGYIAHLGFEINHLAGCGDIKALLSLFGLLDQLLVNINAGVNASTA